MSKDGNGSKGGAAGVATDGVEGVAGAGADGAGAVAVSPVLSPDLVLALFGLPLPAQRVNMGGPSLLPPLAFPFGVAVDASAARAEVGEVVDGSSPRLENSGSEESSAPLVTPLGRHKRIDSVVVDAEFDDFNPDNLEGVAAPVASARVPGGRGRAISVVEEGCESDEEDGRSASNASMNVGATGAGAGSAAPQLKKSERVHVKSGSGDAAEEAERETLPSVPEDEADDWSEGGNEDNSDTDSTVSYHGEVDTEATAGAVEGDGVAVSDGQAADAASSDPVQEAADVDHVSDVAEGSAGASGVDESGEESKVEDEQAGAGTGNTADAAERLHGAIAAAHDLLRALQAGIDLAPDVPMGSGISAIVTEVVDADHISEGAEGSAGASEGDESGEESKVEDEQAGAGTQEGRSGVDGWPVIHFEGVDGAVTHLAATVYHGAGVGTGAGGAGAGTGAGVDEAGEESKVEDEQAGAGTENTADAAERLHGAIAAAHDLLRALQAGIDLAPDVPMGSGISAIVTEVVDADHISEGAGGAGAGTGAGGAVGQVDHHPVAANHAPAWHVMLEQGPSLDCIGIKTFVLGIVGLIWLYSLYGMDVSSPDL